jgi:hypothetical protein
LTTDNHLIIEPANMITLDPQTLSLLVDGTVNALRITFVQAFLGKTTAVISRDILSALGL